MSWTLFLWYRWTGIVLRLRDNRTNLAVTHSLGAPPITAWRSADKSALRHAIHLRNKTEFKVRKTDRQPSTVCC